MPTPPSFLEQAQAKAFDRKHRKTINFNMAQYRAKLPQGQAQFKDLPKAKKVAKNIKWYALENLPRLLMEFENQFQARGGKVIWAENAEQALAAIGKIMKEKGAQTVVKSKSMITEEIRLNDYLAAEGLSVLETDLGEYIVQLRQEPPYHIVTPAMHLSKEDVAQLFHQQFDLPLEASPEQITHFVRGLLRQHFEQAEVGITGANFLVANTGSVVITENEGNARLAATLPKTHIVVAGIEKILPSVQQLELFLPLLASHGTGQTLTAYNTLYNGPQQPQENDGPKEMYVILLDNGRTDVLADPKQRESLYCIRCGACLNVCPVYKHIGGHTYQAPYSGPIGAVLMPNLQHFNEHIHLSNASSLCGACSAACPVGIDLHNLLLDNRKVEQEADLKDKSEVWMWKVWKQVMLRRSWMNAPQWLKNWGLRRFFEPAWGERRSLPQVDQASFNKLWKNGKV